MKTSTFATFATFAAFTTACAGQPFTTAEEASRLPDVSPTVVVAAAEAEPTQEPDAGPTEVPDAPSAAVAPDAGTSEPDAPPVLAEAAAPKPDAGSMGGDATPPSAPVVLCDTVAQAKLFVASTSEVDFVEGVGTVTMKRITLTDESSCSANVAINPMGAQGEFEVVSNCGALNPGDSCTMTVTFLPTNVGRSVASWEVVVLGQQYSFTAVGVGE